MHIEKYDRVAAGHILAHNEPTFARAKRENVDTQQTLYNYNVLASEKSGMVLLKEVLARDDVYCSPRKDVKVLCSCVVSAPDNLPEDRQDEFFYKTALFLNARFENCPCVSAWVHIDELGKNHIHYSFVALKYDHRKERYKVCPKEVITRENLKTLHQDFKAYIDKEMGLDLSILNGATANGNLSIQQLKSKSLNKEITQKKEEVEKLTKLKNKLANQIEYDLCR